MKFILEFAKFNNQFTIVKDRNKNPMIDYGFDETDENYNFFDAIVDFQGEEKKLSIPHDLFIEFLKEDDKNLGKYLDDNNIEDIGDVLNTLEDFNWNFSETLEKYINKYYTPEIWDEMEDLRSFDEPEPEDLNDEDEDFSLN